MTNPIGTHGTAAKINDNGTVEAHGFVWSVLRIREVMHNGHKRLWLNVCKPKGRKVFTMVVYENGLVSPAA